VYVVPVSKNENKEALPVAALSLFYPFKEKVPQLRKQFAGAGIGEVRKGV
jgi:hypothetical protein